MEKQKYDVRKYLMEENIKPRYVGFAYLEKAILLSIKNPSLSTQKLFAASSGIPWESAYHAAQYALKKSKGDLSVTDFIHTAANSLEIGGNADGI